ncbi:hypothetical protein V2J09_022705 [Rumex salicifolius]
MLPFITAAIILLIPIIAIFSLYKKKKKKNVSSPKNLPPGSLGFPFLGETLQLFSALKKGDPGIFLTQRILANGDGTRLFKTSLFGYPTVVFCGKSANKLLFSHENKLVQVWWPPSVHKLFGFCVTTSLGEDAKRLRRLLLSFLGPDTLNPYVRTMDVITRQHISSFWQGKEEVVVGPLIKHYTFELACQLFTSTEDLGFISRLSAQFKVLLKGVIAIPLNFPGTRFYSAMRAADAIRRELRVFVKQRRKDLEEKRASPGQDLLSHLLVTCDENGKFMTEEDIINNILLLLFAGHDTSCSVITILIKYLGELPHVYDQVLKEQNEIAESKAAGELLQWEDVQKMRYSWNVVSEVMRIIPPVPSGFREAIVDFDYEGYSIPKGWKLFWIPASTHKDPSLFPDAPKFEPSRFEGSGPAPYTYVPFGGGPRTCLGKEYARLEILVFLHNIVNNFKWELLIPQEKIEYDPMAAPVKQLPIRLHPHTL